MLIWIMYAIHPTPACAQELVTEDSPPMNMTQDGKVVGISTDKLLEAFRRIGRHPHIQLIPWSRAYQLTLDNPDYCAYSTARTAERETLFKWVGPLASDRWILYTQADNHDKVAKIEDVKNELIGAQGKGALAMWLSARGYRIDPTPYDNLNPAKLLKGRFKYWVSTEAHSRLILAQQELSDQVVPVMTFGGSDLYLACNLAMSNEVVHLLNHILQQMKQDGSSAVIEKKYTH